MPLEPSLACAMELVLHATARDGGWHRAGAPPGLRSERVSLSRRASWAAVAYMAAGLALEGKVNTALKERTWLILAV